MTTSAAIATVGVSELATKIKSFPIGKKTTAADSISFLSARAADAAKFNSVEHMATQLTIRRSPTMRSPSRSCTTCSRCAR